MSAPEQETAIDKSPFGAIDDFLTDIRARTMEPLFVDLGCGQSVPPPDFVGADLYATGDRIVRADLFGGVWPWLDGSVDAFTSSHFLEHVPDWNHHWSEAYRCLKPGGFYRFVGPYAKSDRYLQDPTHCQPLHENKIWYLSQEWRRANRIEHYYSEFNFSRHALAFAYHRDYAFPNGKLKVSDEATEYARTHYWNVVDDIFVVMKKEPLIEVAP